MKSERSIPEHELELGLCRNLLKINVSKKIKKNNLVTESHKPNETLTIGSKRGALVRIVLEVVKLAPVFDK